MKRFLNLRRVIMYLLVIFVMGWTHGLAAVNFINGFFGNFTLGGGLSVNAPTICATGGCVAPWAPAPSNNVILQTTGVMTALRNGSMTSWAHYKYMTNDQGLSVPYKIGIASFTGSISGTTLTVASTPTGDIQLFQRVTDAQNFTTNALTAVGDTVLHFASTTGIAAGMYVTDLTTPRAIAGNITVASTTSTTVTLNHPVGFTGNDQMRGPPGVASGDVIAFSTILRGTQIVGLGTCGATPSYPCNYTINNTQTVSSETMQSAGGWSAEGIYVIPVGTAGTSNYVICGGVPGDGSFTPTTVQCSVFGSLSDLIIRFPIDYADASRINCPLYTGPLLACVSSEIIIQPVTFQLVLTYSTAVSSIPSLNSKIGCPLSADVPIQVGSNECKDSWTNASYDLAPVALPGCNYPASPVTCPYAYTWVPSGINGTMEIEFHANALTNGQFIVIDGFELKQTPGATCNGTAPPCFQLSPGPLEIPEVVSDMMRNARFAQLIGTGWEAGINPGSLGGIETTAGFAYSTTSFLSSWPLPVTMRCDVWNTGQKAAPSCPAPNVYFRNVGDYTFTVAGPTAFTATALAVNKVGLNSIQILATSSGLTAGTSGFVSFGAGIGDLILIDSSVIGD